MVKHSKTKIKTKSLQAWSQQSKNSLMKMKEMWDNFWTLFQDFIRACREVGWNRSPSNWRSLDWMALITLHHGDITWCFTRLSHGWEGNYTFTSTPKSSSCNHGWVVQSVFLFYRFPSSMVNDRKEGEVGSSSISKLNEACYRYQIHMTAWLKIQSLVLFWPAKTVRRKEWYLIFPLTKRKKEVRELCGCLSFFLEHWWTQNLR